MENEKMDYEEKFYCCDNLSSLFRFSFLRRYDMSKDIPYFKIETITKERFEDAEKFCEKRNKALRTNEYDICVHLEDSFYTEDKIK